MWKTKDGRQFKIKDMETSHLQNAIRMLERNAPQAQLNYLHEGTAVLSTMNGEMAQICCEAEIDQACSLDPIEFLTEYSEVYRKLLKELNNRN
jgi:hypothetical protein